MTVMSRCELKVLTHTEMLMQSGSPKAQGCALSSEQTGIVRGHVERGYEVGFV